MKKLPTGIQTFSEIREDTYAYVDKTKDIYKLIENGKYYFLSRPRRFGKSLLIDTISELFLGSKKYFEGLYIYDKWDWETKYPVINISFGGGVFSSSELTVRSIRNKLKRILKELKVACDDSEDISDCFMEIIRTASSKYGRKVVVLVDEYDKPIIDVITNKAVAKENRNILGSFYAAIKDSDRYIKFAMLTGVSKFFKGNLFSSLNNLTDITMDSAYGTIAGYTEHDLDTVFAEHLKGADRERVNRWYNGYNYFAESIYNPFDILQFIGQRYLFKNYWWETGNPNFLIEMLKKSNFYIPDLENLIVEEEALNAFDVEKIELVALLWQTGYLTFKKREMLESGIEYTLKIPNMEIQNSINTLLLTYLVNENLNLPKKSLLNRILSAGDLPGLEKSLKALFAAIPYNNYTKNIMAQYEGYYSSVIYTFMAGLGFDIVGEDVTSRGRIDLTVKTKSAVYILEFKVDSDEDPVKQIKERRYYEKYRSGNKTVYMVGIKFDSEARNISDFTWEKV